MIDYEQLQIEQSIVESMSKVVHLARLGNITPNEVTDIIIESTLNQNTPMRSTVLGLVVIIFNLLEENK